MRILIADDEPLARQLIRVYLADYPDCEVVAETGRGGEAVALIETLTPDLIFLDIHMPEFTGLEIVRETGRQNGVIFSTAHAEHALTAFDLHAVDYLLKPYSKGRFREALQKARALLESGAKPLAPLLEEVASLARTRILVRDREAVIPVAVADIHWAEAEDDYVKIHTADRVWMKTQTLTALEAELGQDQFVRIHRSYLVRWSSIERLERKSKDQTEIVTHQGDRLPVSRSGAERLQTYGLPLR